MKYLNKVAIAGLVLTVVGCASNSDVANIQSQLDALKPQVVQVQTDASAASAAAFEASAKAGAAESAAQRAAILCKEASDKLDNLFKKSQYK